MHIAEPMTSFTDALLALAAIVFAIRTRRAWRYAFLCTGIGAITGGIYHAAPSDLMWKSMVLMIGLANFFLIVAASEACLAARAARLVTWIAAAQFVVYILWTSVHDEFIYVIIDYGSGMLFAAVLYAVMFREASKFVLASVAIAVVAAYVQASRLTLHRNFNYNDLYHVIQIVSLFLLYRGARASPISARTASASA